MSDSKKNQNKLLARMKEVKKREMEKNEQLFTDLKKKTIGSLKGGDRDEVIGDLNKLEELALHPVRKDVSKSLSAEIMESIKDKIKKRAEVGDVEGVLETASIVAVLKLYEQMETAISDKDKREAAKIMLYSGGYKPVERRMNVNANLNSSTESELDSIISSGFAQLPEQEQRKLLGKRKSKPKKSKLVQKITDSVTSELMDFAKEENEKVIDIEKEDNE